MMSTNSKVAGVTGRGAVRSALLFGLLPLAGLLAACGGGGGGGSGSRDADLIVLAVTPTNGQETLSNLSDPGLGGMLTVRFTSPPRLGAMIDDTNAFNGLTPDVQILNQAFGRVAGTPSLDRSTESFTFTPAGGTLPPAQYTVTVGKFVSSVSGKQLNQGIEDFSSSWTVGPDVYPPVVRNTSPAALQSDTPLFTPVVVTFNESLDASTVVLGQTVFVQDGGTNPPTQLNGTLKLKRDGFDLVFVPDPCVGMPPSTTVVVRLLGAGNTSFIRDRVGNGLIGDPANNNEFSFQFNTKGTKPLPNPAVVPVSNSPRLSPNQLWNTVAYASTNSSTFAFDVAPVIRGFAANFTFDPSLTVQVLSANRTWKQIAGVWTLVGPFGGDFEAKLGQTGEAVVDWRFDTATGHAYIFQIDEAREAVAVINTGTGKVEGHFNGTGSPKGIAISGPGSTGLSPTIFVTNFGQGTVTAIPIGTIQPGQAICTALNALKDDISRRLFMQTGRNPVGIACEFFGIPLGMVVNQADSNVQAFDPQTLQPPDRLGLGTLSQKYPVGENPIDVCWSPFIPGTGIFAYIVNQGGIDNPSGSVSLWWNSTGGPFAATTGAVTGSVENGLTVPGRPISDPLALSCYVPNTGSDTIAKVDITVQGGGLFSTIQPKVGALRPVGLNPTKMTWTGPPGAFVALASLAGRGEVAVWERNATIGAPALYRLPGVRSVFSAWDQ